MKHLRSRGGAAAFIALCAVTVTAGIILHAITADASTKKPRCTSASSSISLGGRPTTVWYPKGCDHGG